MRIYTAEQADGWNCYVRSFQNWDVYYLCEYAVSLMLHGDGEPLLICYEDAASRMCYAVMKRDISDDPRFLGSIGKNECFDFETPYGYGGPLADGEFSAESQRKFSEQLNAFCRENGVVSQFIRFHPLLGNQELFSRVSENRYLRDTVYMDTSSNDRIWADMDSKNRNMVRKARKAGVRIVERPMEDYQAFQEMYRETMRRRGADDYYCFSEDYFEFLSSSLRDNAVIFYAVLDDRTVGGAVFLLNEKNMHYHLAGMRGEYRSLAAGNLLLYEAAAWAGKRGITRLHLGGGMAENDSLFQFKKQFNKKGRCRFYIGRTIFDQTAYHKLLDIREKTSADFDRDNGFLIQYRF